MIRDDGPGTGLPEVGQRIPDGTIYAGISPDTGRPMYTTPADAPRTMDWYDSMQYSRKLQAHGHKDWRVPSKEELSVLFNNKAAIGGFKESGADFSGWYWSATEYIDYHHVGTKDQRFSNGCESWSYRDRLESLRCVRG